MNKKYRRHHPDLAIKWFLLQSIILNEINNPIEKDKVKKALDKAFIKAGGGESTLITELESLIHIYKQPIEKGIRWLRGSNQEAANFLNNCLKK